MDFLDFYKMYEIAIEEETDKILLDIYQKSAMFGQTKISFKEFKNQTLEKSNKNIKKNKKEIEKEIEKSNEIAMDFREKNKHRIKKIEK